MGTNHSESAIFNDTLISLLRWRAVRQPHVRAYIFLLDGESKEACLTYEELDWRARAIGALLQSRAANCERALLLYPPGLEYIAAFFGCLCAGIVAVPVYPPDPARQNRTLPRLQAIVQDAQPGLALTTAPILAMAEPLFDQAPELKAMRWLTTDTVASGLATEWRAPALSSETLAFLQYTSGSTAAPKGVMLTHGNLLSNLALTHRCVEITPRATGVSWLPPYHDLGLIGGVLQPLYDGISIVLMSPLDFLQRPLRWLQAISRYKGTISGGPNFAYDLCVRKITPEQRATLDLQSWSVAFNGAEPIYAETLERFAAAFAPCGFRRESFFPCYGLAEATLLVSGGPKAAAPVIYDVRRTDLEHNRVAPLAAADSGTCKLVGCGQIWPEQRVAIVDPETRTPCLPDHVGEIWVSGPCIAQGYWNRPEATRHTFRAYLSGTADGPFLRTGDLGLVRDGELFITSRLKDLIIIRGRNHVPQDIEHTVEKSHPALRPGCGAAFSIDETDDPGRGAEAGERLVIVHEIERQWQDVDVEQVARAIRQAVSENHDLQVYAVVLLKAGTIPKTSSGKLQRHACRAEFLAGSLHKIGSSLLGGISAEAVPLIDKGLLTSAALGAMEPVQRQETLTAYLHGELARTLKVCPSRLAFDQPFTTLGLDSLKALELKDRIETDLGIQVPLTSFIEWPTIVQLAGLLLDKLTAVAEPSANCPDAWQLLAEIDLLSDEEVDAQLQEMVAEGDR